MMLSSITEHQLGTSADRRVIKCPCMTPNRTTTYGKVIKQREKALVESRVFAGSQVFVCFRSQRVIVCELHLASDVFYA